MDKKEHSLLDVALMIGSILFYGYGVFCVPNGCSNFIGVCDYCLMSKIITVAAGVLSFLMVYFTVNEEGDFDK